MSRYTHTDEEKKYRGTPISAAVWAMWRLISALLRRTSHSATEMNPMPPMSAANW
ncbi:MAG: hypothetical protein KatS3mg081_0011 [Gemmatimonadales bacterium]|nr:MAG: hypothetical protein KatS3mg081_0011 [Gemmatimonadales bacterium]